MAKPRSTLLFFLLLLLSGPTPHQATPADHLSQSLFPLIPEEPPCWAPWVLPPCSVSGWHFPGWHFPNGISWPSPPSCAPGWGAAPGAAPAMPALLPALEASQADSPRWDGLERRSPLQSVPQNPRRAELEAQDLSDSTRPQPKQGTNHGVMELQNCSGWKNPPTDSNCFPSTVRATTEPCPHVPQPHVFW